MRDSRTGVRLFVACPAIAIAATVTYDEFGASGHTSRVSDHAAPAAVFHSRRQSLRRSAAMLASGAEGMGRMASDRSVRTRANGR
jgi:hypothetical protein